MNTAKMVHKYREQIQKRFVESHRKRKAMTYEIELEFFLLEKIIELEKAVEALELSKQFRLK